MGEVMSVTAGLKIIMIRHKHRDILHSRHQNQISAHFFIFNGSADSLNSSRRTGTTALIKPF
jgi:hypothetical protein